jgi:hypothetical protein
MTNGEATDCHWCQIASMGLRNFSVKYSSNTVYSAIDTSNKGRWSANGEPGLTPGYDPNW